MSTDLTISAPWLLLWNAVALLVYMTIIFAIAYQRKRLDTVDAAWGGGFVVAATLTAGLQPNPRSFLIMLLIDIWAVRLTNHIIERSRRSEHDDPRYTEIAGKWGKDNYWPRAYVSIFLVQAAAVAVISLPVVFAPGDMLPSAPLFVWLGVLVWLAGFITELAADYQLKQFLADKNNKGKVLEQGLWKYSRHPNYLGEITQWYGIGLIACGTTWGWIGLLGPLALNLLIRYVSGVPPIERRKQKDPAYAAYMKRTNAILPAFRVPGR